MINSGLRRQGILEALAASGLDVDGSLSSGQLVLKEGTNDPDELRDGLRNAIAEIPETFSFLRWGGDMTWSLEKDLTSEKLMDWETHCNTIGEAPAVFLCQYDLKEFPGSAVMDAIRTHPTCVVNDVIHKNPFFQNPEDFLEQLSRR